MAERSLHPVNRDHLDALSGPFGIWQHATGTVANEALGYCTDDVARAFVVDLVHGRELGWDAVRESAWRSLRFLREAFDPTSGRFRNFRERDGSWVEGPASDDSQGRALLALAIALRSVGDEALVDQARRMFAAALPAARDLHALRAASSALIACGTALETTALDHVLRREARHTLAHLASRLRAAFADLERDAEWPWPEAVLTYENALPARALLQAGRWLDDPGLRRTGLWVLDWLIRVQTAADGSFSPIGNGAWWQRGGVRSRFDQQPIEATSMILAAEVAFEQTGETRYLTAIETAYGWFLGDNEVGVQIAETATGGCHDGLTPRGVNLNQGAESTLMWLTALEHVREIRRATSGAGRQTPVAGRVTAMAGSRR